MFGELEVLIPSILLCSLWFTQLIHVCCSPFQYGCLLLSWPAFERVKKSSWVPLGLKISASWSILRTLEMPKFWFNLFAYFIVVCRNSLKILAHVYFRFLKVNFPFTKGEGKRRKLSFPSTVNNFRATFRSPRCSFIASYGAKNELKRPVVSDLFIIYVIEASKAVLPWWWLGW